MATTPNGKATEEEIQTLKLVIDEQKKDYDYLLHIYNRMRATENILLTAAFGVIAYLYYPTASEGSGASDIAQRFFFPYESYGQVIYFIAAAFFLYGIVKLTLNVFGDNPWQTTYETTKKDYTLKPLDTLRYIKERYDECHNFNVEMYNKRKKELKFLFFCIIISAIILIVIKTLK